MIMIIRLVHQASEGDVVVLHYVGRTQGPRGEIFDESKPKGFPYRFEVGGGRAILGLDLGLRGVCKGEVRDLSIPAHLA